MLVNSIGLNLNFLFWKLCFIFKRKMFYNKIDLSLHLNLVYFKLLKQKSIDIFTIFTCSKL